MVRPTPIIRIVPLILALALVAACAPANSQPVVRVTPRPPAAEGAASPAPADALPPATEAAPAPTPAPTPTSLPDPTATPAPKPPRGAVGLEAPQDGSVAAVGQVLQLLAGAGLKAEQVTGEPDLRLSAQAIEGGKLVWEHILVPVDRMSSVLGSITFQELREVWSGAATSPNFGTLYPSQAIMPELTSLLGAAGPAVKPQAPEAVAEAVWGDPMGLGILPFEDLSVRLRAIPIEGNSPADNRFDAAEWPLTGRAWLAPLNGDGEAAIAKLAAPLPISNRDPDKLTVLVMTGVTAMARNSAVAIDRSGDDGFLARQVGPELAAADLTIISNEIPFAPDCVADNTLNNLLLCSRPGYFLNLELAGVDAIGLTGNHMNDFGYDNFRWTLAFYAEKKLPAYGGGIDDKAAARPLILEHNGNRLAFLGANQWGPEWYPNKYGETVSAWAGPDYPGAARFDQQQMVADIRAARPQADLVFAEVQHTEFNAAGDYQVEPVPSQEADFQAMSDGGADVVTGVQAHAPQAVELRNGRLILYGLGNLFFDQTWSWQTSTGLVARHTIYDHKLINTELLVTVIAPNFQLRWATPEERMQVLKSVFGASRW